MARDFTPGAGAPPPPGESGLAPTPTGERDGGRGRLLGFIAVNIGASVAFTAMYATQPVLPQIGHDFSVAPAEAGLTLSGVTFALALASLGAGRLADRFGSRRVMLTCSFALSALCYLVVIAPVFWMLVALRALQGLMVPGITVAGLAFLHNELPARWRGRVSGFYIAANTLGGLVGRLGVGLSVQAIGWRGGLLLVAFAATAGSVVLVVGMPRGAVLTPQPPRPAGQGGTRENAEAAEARGARGGGERDGEREDREGRAKDAKEAKGANEAWVGVWRAPTRAGREGDALAPGARPSARPVPLGQIVRRVWWAPLIGGTVFFPFLSVFTYITFRLEGPPFNLPASGASLFYLVYLLGAVASPLAGQLSDCIGRRPTILGGLVVTMAGLLVGLPNALPLALLGLALVCVGSLSSHAVANASVSDSANPLGARARATALALYTLGFYLGGGLGAYVPGYGWARYGWIGVVVPCAAAVLCAALVANQAPHRARKELIVPPSLDVP